MKLRIGGIGGWLLLFAGAAVAQDAATPAPAARVARLSYLYGSVGFRPASVDQWADATLNYPLSTGDHLWTDRDANAAVEIAGAMVHLAPETGFAILYLDDHMFQVACSQGALNVRVFRRSEGDAFEVDTPQGAVTLFGTGIYRIDVSPQGDSTLVTVSDGSAEVAAGGQVYPVAAGQALELSGNGPAVAALPASAPDPWDEWCMNGDQAEETATAASLDYVSWQTIGVEDLGQYGVWESDQTYGPCWRPKGIPTGWAPYRYGRWVYKPGYGWTWVDNSKWGFAPFHYGRWVELRGAWYWVPQPLHMHPVYTPAAVVFTRGQGNGFVGWVPLGPHENPQDPRRIAQYRNRDSVTVVPREIFQGARQVAPARDMEEERRAMAFDAAVPAIPALRVSILAGQVQPGDKIVHPPERAADRAVVARHELPPEVQPAVAVHVVRIRPPEPPEPMRTEAVDRGPERSPREEPSSVRPLPAYGESFQPQPQPRQERQAAPESRSFGVSIDRGRQEQVRQQPQVEERRAQPEQHQPVQHQASEPRPQVEQHRPEVQHRQDESRPAVEHHQDAPQRHEESHPAAPEPHHSEPSHQDTHRQDDSHDSHKK